MQVIGAIYFKKYCDQLEIEHSSIDEFFNHLLSIACAENLVDWESTGTKISLSGRGDALPNNLLKLLNKEKSNELSKIADLACEISLSQMYGALDLEQSESFLKQVEDIACRKGVSKLDYSIFAIPGLGWGEAVELDLAVQWRQDV